LAGNAQWTVAERGGGPVAIEEALVLRPSTSRRSLRRALASLLAVLLAVAAIAVIDSRSGTTPSSATGRRLTVQRAWTRDLGAPAGLVLDAPHNTEVVTTAGGTAGLVRLTALDRTSGRERWHRVVVGVVTAAVAPGNRLVLVRGDGQVAVHSLTTGKPQWTQHLGFVPALEPAVAPVVAGHVAYFSTYNGLVAIDLRSHFVLWRQTFGAEPVAPPVLRDGVLFATARFLGQPDEYATVRIAAFDARGGTPRWYYDTLGGAASPVSVGAQLVAASVHGYDLGGMQPPGTQVTAQPFVAGGVVVTVSTTGVVTASQVVPRTDPPNGTIWQRNIGPSQDPTIVRQGSGLLVAGGDLAMLDLGGTVRWTAPVHDAYFAAPAAGGVVVATSRTDGRLYVLDAASGHVVSTARGATVVTLTRDSMVTASTNGVVTGYRVGRR
jgi:PQQ-like domain